jgi:hypothetical protein
VRRRHEPSYFTALGQREPAFQQRDLLRAGGAPGLFRASERDYLGSYACAHPFARDGAAVTTSRGLEDFTRLLEAARMAKARVRLYFSPVHARHLAVIEAAGLFQANERWKLRVRELVDAAALAGLDVGLVDLTVTDAFVDEPGGPSWWESSHARPALGERTLASILQRQERADAHQIPAAYGHWKAEHAAELNEIQALALEVLPAERAGRKCRTLPY